MWNIRDLFVTTLLTVSAINYYSGGKYGAFDKLAFEVSTDSTAIKDVDEWNPDITMVLETDIHLSTKPNQKSDAGFYCSMQDLILTAVAAKAGDTCYGDIDDVVERNVPELPPIVDRRAPSDVREIFPATKLCEVDNLEFLCFTERNVWPSCGAWPKKRISREPYVQFELMHPDPTVKYPSWNFATQIKEQYSLHRDCACYIKVFRHLLYPGNTDRRQTGLFVGLVRKLMVTSAKLTLDLQDTHIMNTHSCPSDDAETAHYKSTWLGIGPHEFEPGMCDLTRATLGCILLTSLPLYAFVWLLCNFVRVVTNDDPFCDSLGRRKRNEFTDLPVLV